jgi:murein DD-endopeptidase MepM/ murein hydrolase activator NlpD
VNEKLLVSTVPGILYTVKSGDTLKKIADRYDIKVEDIMRVNEMATDTINNGDVLFLPNAQFTAEERALIYGYIFIKPVHGRFTSNYGYRRHPIFGDRRFHTGIDIAAPTGTSVAAAKEGTVIFAGWKSGYGNCIIIKHQFGYTTLYGHLSRISVRVGQWVSQGQTIGRVGSTGNSTGPHLHFEVLKFGVHTNPISYDGLHRGSGIWY